MFQPGPRLFRVWCREYPAYCVNPPRPWLSVSVARIYRVQKHKEHSWVCSVWIHRLGLLGFGFFCRAYGKAFWESPGMKGDSRAAPGQVVLPLFCMHFGHFFGPRSVRATRFEADSAV